MSAPSSVSVPEVVEGMRIGCWFAGFASFRAFFRESAAPSRRKQPLYSRLVAETHDDLRVFDANASLHHRIRIDEEARKGRRDRRLLPQGERTPRSKRQHGQSGLRSGGERASLQGLLQDLLRYAVCRHSRSSRRVQLSPLAEHLPAARHAWRQKRWALRFDVTARRDVLHHRRFSVPRKGNQLSRVRNVRHERALVLPVAFNHGENA